MKLVATARQPTDFGMFLKYRFYLILKNKIASNCCFGTHFYYVIKMANINLVYLAKNQHIMFKEAVSSYEMVYKVNLCYLLKHCVI